MLMSSAGGRHSRELMRRGLDVVRAMRDNEIIVDHNYVLGEGQWISRSISC
jgi:hypothetical protein